jgi:hypothetical protein
MPSKEKTASTSLTPQRMPLNRHETASMHGQKRRRQRRVRFELDDNENNCEATQHVKKRTRVVALLPLSSEFSPAEKQILWFSGQEKAAISRLASLQAKESRLHDAKCEQQAAAAAVFCNCDDADTQHCGVCLSYRETYTNVFSACYQQQPITPQSLSLLAVLQDNIRGLEDRTVPLAALLRRKIRRTLIRQAIASSQQLKQQQEIQDSSSSKNQDEHLGHLLRSMSEPAVQFARVLGLADAASAMMEYDKTDDSDQSDKQFLHLLRPSKIDNNSC